MAPLNSIWLYYTQSWLYLNLLYSTIPSHDFSYILASTKLYCSSNSFYFILLHSTISLPLLYYTFPTMAFFFTLLDSTKLYRGSTWLFFTLLHSTQSLRDCALLY